MRRFVQVLFGLGFAGSVVLGTGCLDDIPSDCQTDADCGPGARCVLDGVKICVADGAGGAGGSGGSGGTGGTGGAGGTGGSGGAVMPIGVPVGVDVFADAGLAAFLAANERQVREITVRVRVGEGAPVEQVFADPPFESYVLQGQEGGDPLRFVVDAEAAEGRAAVFAVEVEARALLADGALAPFAVASGTVEVEAVDGEIVEAVVVAELVTAFDYDGDEAADGLDCAPDDAAVYPGALDICDGVDADCNVGGACYVLLPKGQSVRDIACGPASCIAAVDADDSDGELYEFKVDAFASQLSQLTVAAPSGVGIALPSAPLTTKAIFVVDPTANRVRSYNLSGEPKAGGAFAPSSLIEGSITISRAGTAGFVPYQNALGAEFFVPSSIASSLTDTNCSPSAACKPVDLSGLSDSATPISPEALPTSLAVKHTSSIASPVLYALFSNESRLGIAQVDRTSGTVGTTTSGLLDVFGEGDAFSLGLPPSEEFLFVAGLTADSKAQVAVLTTGNDLAGHGTPQISQLPHTACAPVSVSASETAVYLASCDGSVITVPATDGVIDSLGGSKLGLNHCSSATKIGVLPDDAGDLLFVACGTESKFAVVGAD